MRYLIPELHGYVELIKRRTVHTPAGIDKVILIYKYECQTCPFTIVQAGMKKIRRSADIHYTGVHSQTTSPHLIKLLNDAKNLASQPPQADTTDF